MKLKSVDWNSVFNDSHYQAICCTTNRIVKKNGELVMGAGIAKLFAKNFPSLPKIWGFRMYHNIHMSGFMVTPGVCENKYLIAFPTKDHWRNPSKLSIIKTSTNLLLGFTYMMGLKHVLLPKPGCSNGGLDWNTEVMPLLEEKLDNRFTVAK